MRFVIWYIYILIVSDFLIIAAGYISETVGCRAELRERNFQNQLHDIDKEINVKMTCTIYLEVSHFRPVLKMYKC